MTSRTAQSLRALTATLLLAAALSPFSRLPAAAADHDGYAAVTRPCRLRFPEDHGAHPGYRTEWWYYTGNLRADDGLRFGFQLTFFRRQIAPAAAMENWPQPPSRWRTQQIFLAHAAVTDITGKTHHHAEDYARGALAMAGVVPDGAGVRIFLKDWEARVGAREHRLAVRTEDFQLELVLEPEKGPVLHGDDGYSRKGGAAERASCYYSLTRLATHGRLRLKDHTHEVRGTSWMDHEFSSAPLEPGTVGWDWFSLQFDDRTELMAYLLRQADGRFSPASSGTFVDESGRATHLPFDTLRLQVLDTWRSARSGARYPARWRLDIPLLRLSLEIVPTVADQEMRTAETTGITYWEGSAAATGSSRGRTVSGTGYVELTGYQEAMGDRL